LNLYHYLVNRLVLFRFMQGIDCGKCFICLPVKPVVQLTALLVFAFSFWELISWFLFAHVRVGALKPVVCHGTRCDEFELFTCAAQEEASMHVVYIYDILGGTVLGSMGLLGAYNGDPKLLKWLSVFLAVFGVLRFAVLLWDTAYTFYCGAYCTHVMEEMIFWPTPSWPISRNSKDLLLQMKTFEEKKADEIAGFNIGYVHSVLVFVAIIFCWYGSRIVSGLCEMLTFGNLGSTFFDAYKRSGPVGANVNLSSWLQHSYDKEEDQLTRDYLNKALNSSKNYGTLLG